MVAPQFFFGQCVNQQKQQQYGQRLAQVMRADLRDQPGPGQGRYQRCHGSGRQRAPGQRHLAAVLPGGQTSAPDGRALVGAKQGGGCGAGKGGKQRRHQNQPAAADDGIDKTGQQRGQRYNKKIHGGGAVSKIKKHWGFQCFLPFFCKGVSHCGAMLFISSASSFARGGPFAFRSCMP